MSCIPSVSSAYVVILRVVMFLQVKYYNFQQIAQKNSIQRTKIDPVT